MDPGELRIWIGSHEVPEAPPRRRASADAYRAEYSHADFEGVPIKVSIIWLSAGLAVALVAPVPFTVTHGAYVFSSALLVLTFAGVRWFTLRRRV